jgi:hypothetical protein
MACGAKDGEIGKAVVGAVAIEMSNLKDLANTETAMNADRGVRVEGQLAVVGKASTHGKHQIDLPSIFCLHRGKFAGKHGRLASPL